MTQKKKNLTWLASCVLTCATLLALATPAHAAEVEEEENETLPLISVSMTDADPLTTIKEQIIQKRSDDGLLDLSTVDIEKSTVSVDHFETDIFGFMTANVSVCLASSDEDAITPIAISFTEPVLLKMVESETPELILKNDEITLTKGDKFEPLSYVGYVNDSSDIYPVLSVESDVDTETPGYYTVTYTCVNTLGLSTIRTMDVHIVKPKPKFRTITLEEAKIADDGSIEAMYEAINAVRKANGLYPFEYGEDIMMKAVAIRAEEASSYVSHYRPDGRYYPSIFKDLNLKVSALEILVMYGTTVQSNLNWWLNSPGHCAVIMDRHKTHIAIGHYGKLWCAEVY